MLPAQPLHRLLGECSVRLAQVVVRIYPEFLLPGRLTEWPDRIREAAGCEVGFPKIVGNDQVGGIHPLRGFEVMDRLMVLLAASGDDT